MYTAQQMNELGKRLHKTIGLPYSPVAIRVYEDQEEIPAEAFRPYRDKRVHYGLCQVISLVKTQGLTIALTKEDHWCWKPLMAFGLVDCDRNTPVYSQVLRNCGIPQPDRADYHFQKDFPRMPRNDNRVILVAPLETASFIPDVILAYCGNITQVRNLIGASKRFTGRLVETKMDYMDSCVYSFFQSHYEREFNVTFPDPGEVGRACCPENEIIFSIPYEKLEMLVEQCEAKKQHAAGRTLKQDGTIMPDFPRPEFYNTLYEMWGLQTGEVSWYESQRGYKI